MGQGNHPDHPPIEGGYTGSGPVLQEWGRTHRGVYRRDGNLTIKYTVGSNVDACGNRERGVGVICQGTFCFIPQAILDAVLRDFGYTIVTTSTPT